MKAQPTRTCLGCRARFPKDQLLKFVLQGGAVVIDTKGTGHGRSAYCCKNKECMHAFGKNKMILSRAFRAGASKMSFDLEDWE